MGRGRRRRKRLRQQQEREAAISTPNTSKAEDFVRGRLGNTVGNKAVQTTGAKGAATTAASKPSTTPSASSFSTPTKKKLEGRPNPVNTIRFSPRAWSKLQWFRDRGSSEIGGFGLSLKEEPLYVIDFLTVKQQCTSTHVEFDDDDVARLLDEMDKLGYTPDELLRIWLHTHPGNSASPSGTDVQTFRDVFGGSSWSIMVILAKGGECTAKLRYTDGPGAEIDLTPQVDLHPPFEGVKGEDYQQWEDEYLAHVRTRSYTVSSGSSSGYHGRGYPHGHPGYGAYDSEYEGWWNDRQNDGTAGFRPTGSQSSGSTTRGSSYGSQSRSHNSRLSDQTEIPPYGGVYRLASRETKKEMQLVNDCVEQVWQVDDNDDDTKTVITDMSWYSFSKKARVNAEVGDDIDSINDISDEEPIACGEAAWRVNGQGKLVPMKITRILSSGDSVDLRANEDVAVAELFQANQKGSTTASDNSTAGFAPASTDKKDDKKDDKDLKGETKTAIQHASSWNCTVCKKPIDTKNAYMVANAGGSSTPGERAHMECISKGKAGWLMVPTRPSKKETEIITVSQASAAASARKESNEPGFGPAASDGGSDSNSNDGGSNNGSGDAAGGTESVVSVGP